MADIILSTEALVSLLYGSWLKAEAEWRKPGNSPKELVKVGSDSFLEDGFKACNQNWPPKVKELITTYFPLDKKNHSLDNLYEAREVLYKKGVTKPPFAPEVYSWLNPDLPDRATIAKAFLPPAHFDKLVCLGQKFPVNEIDSGLDIIYVMMGAMREKAGIGPRQTLESTNLERQIREILRQEHRNGAHPAIKRNFPCCDRDGELYMEDFEADAVNLFSCSVPWSISHDSNGCKYVYYVKPHITKRCKEIAMWMPDTAFNHFSELGKRLRYDAKVTAG